MTRTRRLLIAAMALACAAAGCRTAARGTEPAGSVTRAGDVVLLVKNNNVEDMNVYLLSGGQRLKRLGMVPGNSATGFRLDPVYLVPGLRVAATPVIGPGLARSDPLSLYPGQVVTFNIGSQLALSFAQVR